ncbi:MAG: hypothetical protein ACOYXA_13585 [Bacteroidota bacterium]
MKETNKFRFGITGLFAILITVIVLSCDNEGVDITALERQRQQARLDSIAFVDSLARLNDKLQRFYDSLDLRNQRIYDSLENVNSAGLVSYAITVVDGSTSSFANGRTQSLVSGASVTVSQAGRRETKTTDASGLVVFSGYFRNSINVTIRQTGFTEANYIVGVRENNATPNDSWNYVGNIIPIFPVTGANTATIIGRATIQTNLTNKTRELAPDGTTVLVGIDATDPDFEDKFLFMNEDLTPISEPNADPNIPQDEETFYYVGDIKQANYQTGVVGTVTAGEYTVSVPAAFDGLPLAISYSQVAADQTLFTNVAIDGVTGDRTIVQRTLFGPGLATTSVPSASGISISFDAGSGASASAVISNQTGTVDRINVTNAGSGYTGVPLVTITGGGGTGATATATVANGQITGVTVTSPGSGYTSAPTVTFVAGAGAAAAIASLTVDGTVVGVNITNTGAGYSAVPTITFSPPGGSGTTATGTAVIQSGRLTGITITNPGSGYTSDPTITITDVGTPAATVAATAVGIYSGQSIGAVQITSNGSNYTFAPSIIFPAPSRPNGVRATGTAVIDPNTRQLVGITITNPGSGYLGAQIGGFLTISAFTAPASAQSFLTGGSVLSANITAQGSGYVAPPTVVFDNAGTGGSGAAGTAIIADGKVIGINITSGGSGYTSAPTISFTAGEGANAFATVVNGAISAITVSDGGRNWVGAPRVTISSTVGGGATATATVAGGSITGVTVTAGGTGYTEGNVPGADEAFSGPTSLTTKPGLRYVNDIHYGTGQRQPN